METKFSPTLERIPSLSLQGEEALAVAGLTGFAARGHEHFTPINSIVPVAEASGGTADEPVMID